MLKSDDVVQNLISNGYNKDVVTELFKSVIDDFLERENDKLSETIDIFIDKVQSYYIIDDEDGNLDFGEIHKVGAKTISELNNCKRFISIIVNKMTRIINREPLKTILLEGGAISIKAKSNSTFDMYTYNFIEELTQPFKSNALESIEKLATTFECQDLCLVLPGHGICNEGLFVRLSDFYSLLAKRGIKEDDVSVYISSFPLAESGIYFDNNQIMSLGKSTPSNEVHKLNRTYPQESEQ